MQNRRRGFLISSFLMGAACALPGKIANRFGLNKGESQLLVIFETSFPHSLTHEEYQALQMSYINHDSMIALLEEFVEKGKIFHQKSFFNSELSQWAVVFDSRLSYYDWCYRVIGTGAFNELNMLKCGLTTKNYGCVISGEEANRPLASLLRDLSEPRYEVFHKTLSTSDLNESQKYTLS